MLSEPFAVAPLPEIKRLCFTAAPCRQELVETHFFHLGRPFTLSSGAALGDLTLAYETHGTLAPDRKNAILVFHAFSGSQHVSGETPHVPGLTVEWNSSCQSGWWSEFVGPGKTIDTNRFFVICANMLGSCYGSTGPSSFVPDEPRRRYGGDFPVISGQDIVRSQAALLDHLGVDSLHAVIGASLGGMMALQFALEYPGRANAVIPIATSHYVNAQQQATNFNQKCAIMVDPHFEYGHYYHKDPSQQPLQGMLLARQIAHLTFVDPTTLLQRIRPDIAESNRFSLPIQTPVEGFLAHNAERFLERFDPNSYLRLLDVWQRLNLCETYNASSFPRLFQRLQGGRVLTFSINSDICFPPEQQRELHDILCAAGVETHFTNIHSDKGHDSFLIEPKLYERTMRQFLES